MIPYLSVVVATRNDDHGGDPLKRLQALVNTFAAQCRLTGLSAELIVVEWNPPADRRRVSELLRVPEDMPFPVRFVEVPDTVHRRLLHSDVLPLFQMIAKNVGIRRARGQYVLATNIDVIFSNQLIEYLASRPLQPCRLYRVDRHDIQADFPRDAPLETQMTYCRSHQLRVHNRWGTEAVDSHGTLMVAAADIADGRTVSLGRGWHMRENDGNGGSVRWVNADAELFINPVDEVGNDAVLALDVESNPYGDGSAVTIAIAEGDATLRQVTLSGRASVDVPLGRIVGDGVRTIRLRVSSDAIDQRAQVPLYDVRRAMYYRVHGAMLRRACLDRPALFDYPLDKWIPAYESIHISTRSTAQGLSVSTDLERRAYCVQYGPLHSPRRGRYRFVVRCSIVDGGLTVGVLSGDRQRWITADLLHSRIGVVHEFEVTCEMPGDEMFWVMISNDHPDGYGASRFVIHDFRGSEDPGTFVNPTAPAANGHAGTVKPDSVHSFRLSTVAFRRQLSAAGDSLIAWITRKLSPRVRFRIVRGAPEYIGMKRALQDSAARLRDLEGPRSLAGFHRFLIDHRPDNVHVNACGDFQLMSRDDWHALRGYPEFQTFSMNIDGLFSFIAIAAGIEEQIVDAAIYHLEHEVGSGWSPEGEAALRRRIAESGITWIEMSTVYIWAAYMHWLRAPIVFNPSSWGFGDEALPERVVGPAVERSPA